MAIVMSVFLRFTDSNYPFGIFKLFLSLCKQLLFYHLAELVHVLFGILVIYNQAHIVVISLSEQVPSESLWQSERKKTKHPVQPCLSGTYGTSLDICWFLLHQ
jgi:hypothetical protein